MSGLAELPLKVSLRAVQIIEQQLIPQMNPQQTFADKEGAKDGN